MIKVKIYLGTAFFTEESYDIVPVIGDVLMFTKTAYKRYAVVARVFTGRDINLCVKVIKQ